MREARPPPSREENRSRPLVGFTPPCHYEIEPNTSTRGSCGARWFFDSAASPAPDPCRDSGTHLTILCCRTRGACSRVAPHARFFRALGHRDHSFKPSHANELSAEFEHSSLRAVMCMLDVFLGVDMRSGPDCCDFLEESRRLRDEELVACVRRLARDDRSLTARLLVHLSEVDARGLFRDEAFTSMYAFMVDGLGMSEGEAGLRLCAARVVRRFPSVLELFAGQELHLSGIKLLSSVLNDDNHDSLLAAARGQTKAEIELLLAKHFPKADVADSIRKLPSRCAQRGACAATEARRRECPLLRVALEARSFHRRSARRGYRSDRRALDGRTRSFFGMCTLLRRVRRCNAWSVRGRLQPQVS